MMPEAGIFCLCLCSLSNMLVSPILVYSSICHA